MVAKYQRAFTLIELLVVIAIIGILASVVLAALSSARIRAEDTSRIAAVKQIQSALELYYTNHGRYPTAGGSGYYHAYPYSLNIACGYSGAWCTLETLLEPYISELPRDTAGLFPGMGASSQIRWIYKQLPAAPNMYALGVWLDTPNTTAANDGGIHAQVYEVGPAFAYCLEKYGSGGSPWNWSGTVCAGGN